MTQRMLNMIQSAEDGITLARDELKGPGGLKRCKAALQEAFIDTDTQSMSIGRAAYLAYMLIAWKDAGSPDLCDDRA